VNFLQRFALQGKKTWRQPASRCCWNRARQWHASELVSFLVGLRTYQHFGTDMTMTSYQGRKMASYLFFKYSKLSPVHCMTSGWYFMTYTDNTKNRGVVYFKSAYKTLRCHNPEDNSQLLHRPHNLKRYVRKCLLLGYSCLAFTSQTAAFWLQGKSHFESYISSPKLLTC